MRRKARLYRYGILCVMVVGCLLQGTMVFAKTKANIGFTQSTSSSTVSTSSTTSSSSSTTSSTTKPTDTMDTSGTTTSSKKNPDVVTPVNKNNGNGGSGSGKSLPKTGEKILSFSIAGMAVILFTILVFLIRKKKEEKEHEA